MTISDQEQRAIEMIRWANRENRLILLIQSDTSIRLQTFVAPTRERALCRWLVHNSFRAVRQRLPRRPAPNEDWAQVSRVWSFFTWRPNRADIDFYVDYAEQPYHIKTVSWKVQGTEQYKLRVYWNNGTLIPWTPEMLATAIRTDGRWRVNCDGENLIRAS